ncbi:DUF2017 family protein [Promicromonospora thailandica]|uniref:DUF2017 domain-containing protein n=1 Tax=Promicromonospora thailandica TaxID=765201 RepID=A0A9X2FYM8_9MICO|nr:DUF2017 family protein [Promicromonospora thailandica]MCP2262925.1 protein of unknown function (DUF2017) [Promicromonospora thailandica]BFF18276.1 hypothetical protein GCM10025730_17970 [Promicromonospora thailandica]
MTPFRAMRRGYEARLEPVERVVLARVARDVADMLREEAGLDLFDDGGEPGPSAHPGPGKGQAWANGLLAPDELTDADLARLTGVTGIARHPTDPAAQRLLPDASKDDPELAGEFRRLTQNDVARAKVDRLEAFAALLDLPSDAPSTLGRHGAPPPVRVPREDAEQFAGALTDVRLVIAERLGLKTDEQVMHLTDEIMWDRQAGREIPVATDGRAARRFWSGVFVAAGYAQETLMDVMLAELRGRRPLS